MKVEVFILGGRRDGREARGNEERGRERIEKGNREDREMEKREKRKKRERGTMELRRHFEKEGLKEIKKQFHIDT